MWVSHAICWNGRHTIQLKGPVVSECFMNQFFYCIHTFLGSHLTHPPFSIELYLYLCSFMLSLFWAWLVAFTQISCWWLYFVFILLIRDCPIHDKSLQDYSEMSKAYRPSHADATYDFKYGLRSVQVWSFICQQIVLIGSPCAVV